MFLTVQLQKLRNSEFIQFIADLIFIFQKQNTEELGIKEQVDPISPNLEIMKTIHGKMKGSDISDELKAIDNRRDDCIKGIHAVLDGFTYHFDTNIKEAAQTLLNIIDTFGSSIAKQNYPTETTSLKGIIEIFNTQEKAKNAVKLLNMATWAGQMEKENNLFNTRYLDRVDETAKLTEDKIKELRKSITEKYFTLRDHVTAHATLKQNGNYQLIIDQLNALIDKYNGIIKKRVGNNKTDVAAKTDTPVK